MNGKVSLIYTNFEKRKFDKKNETDDLKESVESYSEYLASQIYELQVRLKSQQDEVANSVKNKILFKNFSKYIKISIFRTDINNYNKIYSY